MGGAMFLLLWLFGLRHPNNGACSMLCGTRSWCQNGSFQVKWKSLTFTLSKKSHDSLRLFTSWTTREASGEIMPNSTHQPSMSDFAFLVAQMIKNLPAMQDTWVLPRSGRFLGEGNGYPLPYSCQENPITKESGRLQSMGLQRVRHDWSAKNSMSWHQCSCSHSKPQLQPCLPKRPSFGSSMMFCFMLVFSLSFFVFVFVNLLYVFGLWLSCFSIILIHYYIYLL